MEGREGDMEGGRERGRECSILPDTLALQTVHTLGNVKLIIG